jgi:hypothetical protein
MSVVAELVPRRGVRTAARGRAGALLDPDLVHAARRRKMNRIPTSAKSATKAHHET